MGSRRPPLFRKRKFEPVIIVTCWPSSRAKDYIEINVPFRKDF